MREDYQGVGRPDEDASDRSAASPSAGFYVPSSNDLSGVVHGSAVQARSIEGGVHFTVAPPAPAPLPIPAQLPLPPAHLTGRSRELGNLDALLLEGESARRATVVVVSGVGGVGKTSLASHWLHRVSDRYEGALFADLRGHIPEAAARPGDVLGSFLRSLGTPPERIPFALDEQAALYRSVTSGRRLIVLLDNAASAAQVRALLPGPVPATPPGRGPGSRPSLVVVTTRWRIAGLAMDGARFIELGPLDETSATELFGHVAGAARADAEPEAARSVIRSCGSLPLAVCVAAARLASHASWPVSRVAEELASDRHRLRALSLGDDLSVGAAFDLSYQVLPPDAARLYRLLSLLPGTDFCLELAAAGLAADPGYTAELLDTLTGASLVEETPNRRFRLHDLLKLHSLEQVDREPAAERKAVVARAIDWYLRGAVAADLVMIPGRWRLNAMYEPARAAPPAYGSTTEALEWLESELPGLLASIQEAHEDGLHEQAWQLCEAMWGLFTYGKHFQYWIEAHLTGLASAQACGDRRAEARMRVQLGYAYLNVGRESDARAEFARALVLSRAEGHRIGEATALEHLGLADLKTRHPGDAIAAFTQARDIFAKIGQPRGVLGMTRHIGEAHRDAGRYEQAVSYLMEARRLSVALPDRYNEARCLTSLGQAYLGAGQIEDAAGALRAALAIMTSLGGHYEQALIRASLAEACRRLGDTGEARRNLQLALTVYAGIGAPEAQDVRRRLAELGSPAEEEATGHPEHGRPEPSDGTTGR